MDFCFLTNISFCLLSVWIFNHTHGHSLEIRTSIEKTSWAWKSIEHLSKYLIKQKEKLRKNKRKKKRQSE